MIALRRAKERHSFHRNKHEAWHTFYQGDRADVLDNGFGLLELLNENSLPPGTGIPPDAAHDAELVTYVRKGALSHEDPTGCSGVIAAGEFQRTTASTGVRHREWNASRTDSAHVFQIWLRPTQAGREVRREQKRFSAADRRGLFCVVASPDGRKGSLQLNEDVVLYSAILEPGQHVIHELLPGRTAWLHMVIGEATFGQGVLSTGDGVGVTGERAVSLTAREMTEVLLLDLGSLGTPD